MPIESTIIVNELVFFELMEYKNIIFDLGNVLVRLDSQACMNAFKAIGMGRLVDMENCPEAKQLMGKLGVGMITTEAFCDEARLLTGSTASNEQIKDAANKMLVEIPDEKKLRLLALRDKGYRLFLLSNTIDIHWDYCVEHLFPLITTGLNGRKREYGVEHYFERVFLSQRLHLSKPDAKIYQTVIDNTGIIPSETLFIDDLKENCEAAEKLGIHTFQNKEFDDWLGLEL